MNTVLEVVKISIGVNPCRVETDVSLNVAGMKFINESYGITEEEIVELVENKLKKTMELFNQELNQFINTKVKYKLNTSTTEDLEKELQKSLGTLISTFFGEVK